MKTIIFKTLFLTVLYCFFGLLVNAQDIIVKKDKLEVKAKVIEITDAQIKYKKREMQDGPLYNVSKADVFMIIYANGQRESIVNSATSKLVLANSGASDLVKTTDSTSAIAQPVINPLDTLDYKTIKVKYKPIRIYTGLQSPTSIGVASEVRIIKNYFNLGLDYAYQFYSDDYILSSQSAFIYGSIYAPINRLLRNFKKQDKGLFAFVHLGYGLTGIKYSSQLSDGGEQTISTGGFTYRVGMDYSFGGFGLTLFTQEFTGYYAGIAILF